MADNIIKLGDTHQKVQLLHAKRDFFYFANNFLDVKPKEWQKGKCKTYILDSLTKEEVKDDNK